MAGISHETVSRVKAMVAQRHGIEAGTDVAARTIALLLEDARCLGQGLWHSLTQQLRLLVGPRLDLSEASKLAGELCEAFAVTHRIDACRCGDVGHLDLSERLSVLAGRYPWPLEPPRHVERNEDAHFFSPGLRALLERALRDARPRVIVEIGSWLGGSTRYLLEKSDATVIAVDTWLGSEEHQPGRAWMERHPAHGDILANLHATFLKNCWNYQDRLIVLRTTSIDGLHQVRELGISPELVLLDGAHDHLSVRADLELCLAFFPHGQLVVDDYSPHETWLQGLVETVDQVAQEHGRCLIVEPGQACMLVKTASLAHGAPAS